MDWQIIASVVVSVGALLAFFALGERPEPRPRNRRKVQGHDDWKPQPVSRPLPRPVPRINDDVIDRFANALKAQSRPPA